MGTGRRKSSVASVKLVPGEGQLTINKIPGLDYVHKSVHLLGKIEAPLHLLGVKNRVDITIKVAGGGLVGQADAIRLGVARALCDANLDYRITLKRKGYLTRDARVKERKKYGLKKARKASQYSKR